MKVSVSGANGFVGAHVVRTLLARGHEVTALVGPGPGAEALQGLPITIRTLELTDEASVEQALQGGEGLIHCAACYSFWERDRALIYQRNVIGTRNILRAAKRLGYKKVVYTSSTATLTPSLWDETGDEESVLDVRRFPGHYKLSKLLAEKEAWRIAASGLPLVTVHPSVVIGRGDRRPTPTGEMILHFLNGKMKAYLDITLNIVDVEDVALGHVLALEKGVPGHRYVLGGENLRMHQMLKILSEITGFKAPWVILPKRLLLLMSRANEFMSDHITRRPPLMPVEAALHARKTQNFSYERARTELGYNPRSAREALVGAVEWFLEHPACHQKRKARVRPPLSNVLSKDAAV